MIATQPQLKVQNTAQKTVVYFSNLTPLRGIAAMLTVVFHIGIFIGPVVNILHISPAPGPLINNSMLINHMYLMVDFFFILSGFIMCHVYGRLFTHAVKGVSFKKFAVARFARVYPLHLITLIFTIFLFAVSGNLGVPRLPILQVSNNGYSILTNLLLLQSMNTHNWFTWVHASWSISTEWWAYMIFPFLVRPFVKSSAAGKMFIALLCFAGYMCIMFFVAPMVSSPPELHFGKTHVTDYSLNISYQFGFLRCLCGFLLGMLIYQCYQMNWGKKLLANGYAMLIAATASFISMHYNWPDIISVLFLPFVILSGAYGSKTINSLFGKKAMQKIGDWSFSIYLVHQPLIFAIGALFTYFSRSELNSRRTLLIGGSGMLTGWVICIVLIAFILPVSFLTYRFFELPARKWINSKVK